MRILYMFIIVLLISNASAVSYFGIEVPQKDLSNEEMLDLAQEPGNKTGGIMSDDEKQGLVFFSLFVIVIAMIILRVAYRRWEGSPQLP